MPLISEERLERFRKVAANRQRMTVVLENVHDPHNIGAVLRSCDSVGIDEVYILYTEEHLDFARVNSLKSSATGVKKWLKLHFYRNREDCFSALRKNYSVILATHLAKQAQSIYDSDLTRDLALVFGNEHEGVSSEALDLCDGNLLIPQVGMAQSLNISVACAVSLYESMRQRLAAGMYSKEIGDPGSLNQQILDRYIEIHKESYRK